jgi:hypothetical protein
MRGMGGPPVLPIRGLPRGEGKQARLAAVAESCGIGWILAEFAREATGRGNVGKWESGKVGMHEESPRDSRA